jgi:hypothetical protein
MKTCCAQGAPLPPSILPRRTVAIAVVVAGVSVALLVASQASAAGVTRTLATDGAWTWFNDPRGIVDNGKL